MNEVEQKLFSYGTLQLEEVQMATFGRRLMGKLDVLSSYRLVDLKIKDQDVLTKSGQAVHPIAVYTGNSNDKVSGMVFAISSDELLASDKYEVADYQKVQVILDSGVEAWGYVKS